MFDIGWSEMVVVGVVALIVIGPKELPGVIRSVGKAVGKLKTMAGEFRGQFDEAMREADLHEVKKTFDEAASTASSAMNAASDPLNTIRDEVRGSFDGLTDDGAISQPDTSGKSETIAAIEADARALEAEPEAKPRKSRKKAVKTAGDDA